MISLFIVLFFVSLIGGLTLNTTKEALRHEEIEAIKKKALFYHRFHQKLFKHDSLFLLTFAATLTATLMTVLATLSATLLFFLLNLSLLWLLIFSLISLFLILFLIDFLPSCFGKERSGWAFPISSIYLFLLSPLTLPFLVVKKKFCKSGEQEDLLDEMRENILAILKSTKVMKRLDPTDKRLLESIIQFKDLIVKEVMVPRVQLFSLSATTSIREAAKLLAKEGYSRAPLYRDSLDNIIGLLLFKDILQIYMEVEEGRREKSFLNHPIETIMKGVFYTPETKKVSHLLQEFRSKQKHMAIVVDEYGGTEGVVTIEDILEEIVGQIADEHDVNEEILYQPDPEGRGWTVDARMNLKDAEDIFGIEFPKEGDYDTISGLIFFKEGSIPPKGTLIDSERFTLEILSTSERAVEKVRLTLKKEEEKT